MAVFATLQPRFLSTINLLNVLRQISISGLLAIGMTFVILSGGIDLSVGAVVALTAMISAALVEHHGWSIGVVVPRVLPVGCLFGLMMGVQIQVFRIQPFIVTLGGMFLARGLCYLISIDSISITDPIYTALSQYKIQVGGGNYVSPSVVIALVVFAAAAWLAHCSRFFQTSHLSIESDESPCHRLQPLNFKFSSRDRSIFPTKPKTTCPAISKK